MRTLVAFFAVDRFNSTISNMMYKSESNLSNSQMLQTAQFISNALQNGTGSNGGGGCKPILLLMIALLYFTRSITFAT